jgi:hypothetical protein
VEWVGRWLGEERSGLEATGCISLAHARLDPFLLPNAWCRGEAVQGYTCFGVVVQQ